MGATWLGYKLAHGRRGEIGIDSYLNKPVGRSDLLETIQAGHRRGNLSFLRHGRLRFQPINAQELFTLIESLPATVKVDRN
jgi:DNA-binding response OmpR family regulator